MTNSIAAANANAEVYAVHDSARATALPGCFVELHADGTVVLVVDGEQLFRFDSFDALLAQYDLIRGELQPPGEPLADDEAARRELRNATIAAGVELATIAARPRAEKALVGEDVARAIERVRRARALLAGR